MRKPNPLYANQLQQVYDTIDAVENGQGVSLTLRGRTWSTLADLYQLAELVRLEAAIAAIEEGAQSYSIDDHTFTRAEYRMLCERRDRIQRQLTRATAGGIRVRNVVPIP